MASHHVQGAAPSSGQKRGKRDLSELKQFLDRHFCEKISLDALSSRFFINKFYMTRLFRSQFGMPILQYLLSLRIENAKRLLLSSGESAETIGAKCGFPDANYFSRAFGKAVGISPTEFRRANVEKT